MINGFGIFTPKFAGNLRTSILTLVFVLLIAVTWSGCWRDSAADRYTDRDRLLQEKIAQDETSIRAASAAWSIAEASISFFADTAILLSAKSRAVKGKENIRRCGTGCWSFRVRA